MPEENQTVFMLEKELAPIMRALTTWFLGGGRK